MSSVCSLTNKKQTPWPESASEVYQPNDRRLSGNLVPTFADRGHCVPSTTGSLRPHSRLFRPEPLFFLPSSSLLSCTHEAVWTPFRTHYSSENLVAPEIEPVTSGFLGFLDRSRYSSFQVAPQLYSRGWVDPVPDPLLLRKSGSAGNRTRDLWILARNSDQ
jgi:hypothetical protein